MATTILAKALLPAKITEFEQAHVQRVNQSVREANARADQAWRELAEVAGQLRGSRTREPSERPSLPDAGARGDVLRTILDRETSGNGFTGAVITDELGLVVASKGEYGDALAAYGAFLAGVGAKTRDALPLRELRQLTIQDDYDTTSRYGRSPRPRTTSRS